MFFLREWEVIWKNSRRDWNEQIEDLQFIQNWIQHTKVLTGVPTAGARELRQNWAGSNGKKSANLSQSWKLTQESKGLAHAGYAAKNLPRSHASQVPYLGCPWIGSANPIQDNLVCCFNMFQPPENHYIFIQIHILNRDGNPDSKGNPKNLPPAACSNLFPPNR